MCATFDYSVMMMCGEEEGTRRRRYAGMRGHVCWLAKVVDWERVAVRGWAVVRCSVAWAGGWEDKCVSDSCCFLQGFERFWDAWWEVMVLVAVATIEWR